MRAAALRHADPAGRTIRVGLHIGHPQRAPAAIGYRPPLGCSDALTCSSSCQRGDTYITALGSKSYPPQCVAFNRICCEQIAQLSEKIWDVPYEQITEAQEKILLT